MKKLTSHLLVLALFATLGSASGATMVIDSLTGAPDQNEIDSFVTFMNGQTPPANNFGNAMADHTSSQRFDALGLMYEATQDQDILDIYVKWADDILANRNDKTTKLIVWDGKIEPNWPSGVDSTDSSQAAASTQGEQGWVLAHMVCCAQLILRTPALWNQTVRVGDPHGYGSTYLARAKTYVQQADFTESSYLLKWFIQNNTWTFPAQSTGFDGSTWFNKPFPWNQQAMLNAPLIRLADCHSILGDNPALVSQYNTIVQTWINNWYNHDLVPNQTSISGHPAFYWHYEDPTGLSSAIEDVGHGAFDCMGIWTALFSTSQNYSLNPNQLQYMANTVRYGIDVGGGVFNDRLDGSTGTQTTLQAQYFMWAKWYPQIYTDMANADRSIATTTPTYFAAIMWTKWAISKNWNLGGGATLDTASIYHLENVASGLALNQQGSLTNGSKITQWTAGSTSVNLQWKFIATANGYYQINSVKSGLDAVVQSASTSAGAGIVQWSFGSSGDDQWKPVANSDGSYTFYNLHSGLVLEDPGSSTSTSTQMDQWGANGGNNQKWKLVKQ